MPIVFFKTGWMSRYQGMSGDTLFSTMRFVKKHEYGHERDNFKVKRGKCLGYAPLHTVNIDKLGAQPEEDYIDGVDVVWCANRPRPLGGLVVVGWYRDARVYRHPKGERALIIAEADAKNCTLLPVGERTLELPLVGEDSFRSTRVWYATNRKDIVRVAYALMNGTLKPKAGKAQVRYPDDPDITRRVEVEKSAVRVVSEKYTKLGYDVHSVEQDKVGWDLTARRGREVLQLEVKGTAHDAIMPLLTPNEYKMARKLYRSFRICIVTHALERRPRLIDLRYVSDQEAWMSEEGTLWDVEQVQSGQLRPR